MADSQSNNSSSGASVPGDSGGRGERAGGRVGGGRVGGAVDWCFRSRTTGEIVIGQFPNLSFAVFLVAAVVRWIATRWIGGADGNVAAVAGVVATVALVVWALDEIIRGVNPWRRALGAGVLIAQLVGLVAR